jgi:hypothetical protein
MGERVSLPGRQQLLSIARVQGLWGSSETKAVEQSKWRAGPFLLPSLRRLLCRFVARAAQSLQVKYKSNS